jgi:hypothetical protein
MFPFGEKAARLKQCCFPFHNFRVTIKIPSGRIFSSNTGWTAMTAMNVGDWLKSEVVYGRDLAGSGWQGALNAWDTARRTEPVGEMFSRSVRSSLAPTFVGAGVGALCALLVQRRKSSAPAAVALGVVGGVVGFTACVAWETRQISSEVARGAMRKISSTRDSHWLGRNPINFG